MKIWIRWLNAIGLVAVYIMNWLAEQGKIAGVTTGELSDKYPVVITPAGYAFSIWLLIYVLLACFIIYSFTPSGRKDKLIDHIGVYFILSCVFNIGWLWLWQYEKIASSLFMMYALLITLIIIYVTIFREKASNNKWNSVFIKLPFTLYTGWICVAATINTMIAFKYSSQLELSENLVGASLLIAAVVFVLWLSLSSQNAILILVLIWAMLAIAIEQNQNSTILIVSICGIIASVIGIILIMIMRLKKRESAM